MAGAGPDATDAPDRWLRKGSVAPAERVPLLAEALATAALHWGEGFSNLAGGECVVTFTGLAQARVADLPQNADGLPIFAALRVPAWDGAVLGLCLDRGVVSAAVEAFFGGGGDESAPDASRPLSPIEARIVDVLGGQAAAALAAGWRELLPTRVEFDRTMPKPDPGFLGKPATALLLAGFAIKALGRTVQLSIALPQAAIDARGALWGDETAAAPAPDEAVWSRQLSTEVSRASLRIEAGIAMAPMSLGALAGLRVGQVIEMPLEASANVLLRCGEAGLFRCHLGQSAGFYTVRVDGALDSDHQPPRKGR